MDSMPIDDLARLFAARRFSRRRAVRQGVAGLAAEALATSGFRVAAQDATPATTALSDTAATGATMDLFIQSFESGTIAPNAVSFTLRLAHGLGQTIYFSNRPERIVGAAPTSAFLDGVGFSPESPPNAALLVEDGSGGINLSVVELTNSSYDEGTLYDAVLGYAKASGMCWDQATRICTECNPAPDVQACRAKHPDRCTDASPCEVVKFAP